MRRVLFATLVLVLLLTTASTALAQPEPAQLGEVWWFLGSGFAPFEEVDMYLYRPSTAGGWPWLGGPAFGGWWWTGGDSEQRRQSYPAWQEADGFGWYYAEFMLPRDEVWYPCSYPLKWKCNYEIAPAVWEYHSPADQSNFEFGLIWPWLGNPMDTVSPLEAYMVGEFGGGFIFPFEVTGMFWKWSDLP